MKKNHSEATFHSGVPKRLEIRERCRIEPFQEYCNLVLTSFTVNTSVTNYTGTAVFINSIDTGSVIIASIIFTIVNI